MKIEYYANGCGTGKTTRLKQLIQNHPMADILVIVPSIALAREYTECGTVVVGGNEEDRGVLARIADELEQKTKVLIITSAAFAMASFKDKLVKDRTVIQDESMDVVDGKKWKLNNHTQWIPMFELTDLDNGWFRVKFNEKSAKEFEKSADSLDNIKPIKELLSTPKDLWANNSSFDEHTTFFEVVSPAVYAGARKVIIACANFECTFQYKIWSNLYAIEFDCKEPFQPYLGKNTFIHSAEQKINSIMYNRRNPSIRHAVIDYTIKNAAGSKVVVVDNIENHESLPRAWAKVKHNCHGINEHRAAKHIAFLSAINFNTLTQAFLVDICKLESDEVSAALLGEMAHQVLMRGVLRQDNDAECHFYLMSESLAFHLKLYLFPNAELVGIPNTAREEQAREALTPISQVERNKARHIRKAYPQFNDIDIRTMKGHLCWDLLNDRGRVKRSVLRDFTGEQIQNSLVVESTTNSTP